MTKPNQILLLVFIAGIPHPVHGQVAGKLPAPVAVVKGSMKGHVHPSICRTTKGTLLVSYQGRSRNVLMVARSVDGGAAWSEPVPAKATSARPDGIPVTPHVEVYPGAIDALKDGRALLTWNYIARDPDKKFYARPLLFSISKDDGQSWSEAGSFGKFQDQDLGAMRQPLVELANDEWLLPRRESTSLIYKPSSGTFTPLPVRVKRKSYSCIQIVQTGKGTLLAMSSNLLRSTDRGKTWEIIEGFPGPATGDSGQGRSLTPMPDGSITHTWGVGRENKGIYFSISRNDGKTWSKPYHRLAGEPVTARFGSARSVPLDKATIGTIYFNKTGLYFVKTPLSLLK